MNTIWPEPVNRATGEASSYCAEAVPAQHPSVPAPPSAALFEPGAPARSMPEALSKALTTCEKPAERLQSPKLFFIGPKARAHKRSARERRGFARGTVGAWPQGGAEAADPGRATTAGDCREPLPQLYLSAPACSGPEGFVLGLITAAAVLSVFYGVNCGLQLVQNWSLFSSGIATLIR